MRDDGRHTCPYPGCELRVRDDMFACRAHWYSLPTEIRESIWRAFRRHRVGSDELREAHAAARQHWGSS